jgi:hypothetical protein
VSAWKRFLPAIGGALVILLIAGVAILRFCGEDRCHFLNGSGPSTGTGSGKGSSSSTSSLSAEANIVVTQPHSGDEIGLPLVIKGEARVFENTFSYRLLDEDEPKGKKGILEVFDYSAKDGAEIDKVSIPVLFKQDVEALTVQAFFMNSLKDPETLHCEVTYAVSRRIEKRSDTARAAMEELLKGPSVAESNQGFQTAINPFVMLQKIILKDGIATVDFDDDFLAGVAGSCRVQAIRSQIEHTLKQFSSIKSVVISVNGESDGILQP